MKCAKLYLSREDLKERLGIEVDQFVIADIENTLDEIEITVVIDNDAITKGEVVPSNYTKNTNNLRRFSLMDKQKITYDFEDNNIKITDEVGNTVFEASEDGGVKFSGEVEFKENKPSKLQNELEKYLNQFISDAKIIHSNPDLKAAYTNEEKDRLMFGVGLLGKILEEGLKSN